MAPHAHWEQVYRSKRPDEVSWYRPHLERSLAFIRAQHLSPDARVVDIGGGASTLVDDLLAAWFRNLAVVDLAPAALAVALESLGDGAQGPDLVLAAGDLRVGLELGQRALRTAAGDQRLDLRGRVEFGDAARRVAAGVVPQEDLVAVGIEDDRAATVLALERVGVALGLGLATLGVGAGLLGLDDGEWRASSYSGRPSRLSAECIGGIC